MFAHPVYKWADRVLGSVFPPRCLLCLEPGQRPGLDLKTRSLVTVAMLTALGHQHELKGHVRGALRNGASTQEIQEVLLHAGIYCGVPCAVEAFRSAAEVVDGAPPA